MARKFRRVDYTESLKQTVMLADCLAPEHLARFIVGIIALLDLSAIYAHYAPLGGEAFAPEVLVGVLFYGYAAGVFSSRKLETATYLSLPFRFIVGGWHPDHDTLATFRKTFLAEIGDLLTQVLVVAHELGVFTLGHISVDGSKIHADASKSRAVSYGHLPELEQRLRTEVDTLMALGEHADQSDWPEGLDVTDEISRRRDQLLNLSMAKAILEARAQERFEAEQAEYEAKMREWEAIARETGHRPRSPAPARPA